MRYLKTSTFIIVLAFITSCSELTPMEQAAIHVSDSSYFLAVEVLKEIPANDPDYETAIKLIKKYQVEVYKHEGLQPKDYKIRVAAMNDEADSCICCWIRTQGKDILSGFSIYYESDTPYVRAVLDNLDIVDIEFREIPQQSGRRVYREATPSHGEYYIYTPPNRLDMYSSDNRKFASLTKVE